MIKQFIERMIRRKNPNFMFDSHITSRMIWSLLFQKANEIRRGMLFVILGKLSKISFIGKGVKIQYSQKIKMGKWLRLEDQVRLSGLGEQGIEFGNYVRIGAFSSVIVSTSFNDLGKGIRIGDHVGIGEYAYLGGAGGLEIGANCIIGQYLSCHPENHNFDSMSELIRLQGVNRKGIKIGENCWIGSKVTLLDGVEVGDHCVIAAGAVLTKKFPSNCVIGGVPARILKYREAPLSITKKAV